MQPNIQQNGITLTKLKQLLSENNSLMERLNIATATIASRESEIAMLQQMLDEAVEMRSHAENKLKELEFLQKHFDEMKTLV